MSHRSWVERSKDFRLFRSSYHVIRHVRPFFECIQMIKRSAEFHQSLVLRFCVVDCTGHLRMSSSFFKSGDGIFMPVVSILV